MRLLLILGLSFAFFLSSCAKKESYKFSDYFDTVASDSILTNIIINTYKVPRGVRKENKWNQEYRNLYEKQLPEFEMIYFHYDSDSQYYYYFLIRPARNVHGHKRGASGKFKLGDKGYELIDFEEIFNTPMLVETDIREKGAYLWKDLMYYKNVDRYLNNKHFIEFPDKRTRYDKELKEWVYYH